MQSGSPRLPAGRLRQDCGPRRAGPCGARASLPLSLRTLPTRAQEAALGSTTPSPAVTGSAAPRASPRRSGWAQRPRMPREPGPLRSVPTSAAPHALACSTAGPRARTCCAADVPRPAPPGCLPPLPLLVPHRGLSVPLPTSLRLSPPLSPPRPPFPTSPAGTQKDLRHSPWEGSGRGQVEKEPLPLGGGRPPLCSRGHCLPSSWRTPAPNTWGHSRPKPTSLAQRQGCGRPPPPLSCFSW